MTPQNHLTETEKDEVARLVHEYVDAYNEGGFELWCRDQLGARFSEQLVALGPAATGYANSLIEQMTARDEEFGPDPAIEPSY